MSAVAGLSRRASYTGLYAFLATVIMFFAAFTSAMVVRRGDSKDWQGVPAPSLLWVNTAVLAVSSVVAEKARRDLRNGDRNRFNANWCIATVLGVGFAAGQIVVWRQLWNAGIGLEGHPGSAFFYVGTVAHALHLLGGLCAMAWLAFRAIRLQLGPAKRTAVDIATVYWHFLGVLWLYLLWLFRFWGN